jgi:copper(I)-binding protein
MDALKRRGLLAIALGLALTTAGTAHAHDFKAGDLRIDHPYATPTVPGQTTGAVYLRTLRNTGDEADELLGASTLAAAAVELHRMQMDGNVMRMRAVDGIALPPHSELTVRHQQTEGYHLMLQGLKQPLTDGDRFAVTLRFRRAGEHTVNVWVQKPRSVGAHNH